MPGGDRTGPFRYGPMTGRGAGFCTGYAVPGFNPGWGRDGGRGFGWRRGGGRGFGRGGGGGGWRHRHCYYATGLPGWHRGRMAGLPYVVPYAAPFSPSMAKEQELEALRNQAKYFEQALQEVRGRIREVELPAEGSETT